MTKLPKIIIITESPFSNQNGFGVALHSLFQGYPKEKLFQLCSKSSYSNVSPDLSRTYGIAWLNNLNIGGRFNYIKFLFGLIPGHRSSYSKQWLTRNLQSWRPELIYSFVFSPNTLAYSAWASKILSLPHIVHVTDNIDLTSPVVLDALRTANVVLAATDDLANLLTQVTGRACRSFPPVGSNTELYNYHSRQKVESDKTEFTLRYVGTTHNPDYEDSNFQTLDIICKAIDQLNAEGLSSKFEIYGSASDPQFAQKLALHTHTFYKGVPNMKEGAELLLSADALIIPLSFNPVSREAMKHCYSAKLPDYLASGSPTIIFAPSESAISKICKQSKVGWVISEPNVSELIGCFRLLAEKPEAARRCAMQHRSFAVENLSSKALSNKLRNLFIDLHSSFNLR